MLRSGGSFGGSSHSDHDDVCDSNGEDITMGETGMAGYVHRRNKQVKRKTKSSPVGELEEVHRTAAMLVRETRVAQLDVGVEKPASLNAFLQSLQQSNTNPNSENIRAHSLKGKAWASRIDPDRLKALSKLRPKLTCDPSSRSDNLTVVGVPGTSQREVTQRRARQALAPRVKKPSIDQLNARLDGRIAMQRKSQALLLRLNKDDDDDSDAEADEPRYETFKNVRPEDHHVDEEEGEGHSDSNSDNSEDTDNYQLQEEEEGEERAGLEWKAGAAPVHDLNRRRAPVIPDSDDHAEDAEDRAIGRAEDQMDSAEEDRIDELLSIQPDWSKNITNTAGGAGSTDETLLTGPAGSDKKQSAIIRFLSGTFSAPPPTSKTEEKASARETVPPQKRPAYLRDFFEEEAEDEDEDEEGEEGQGEERLDDEAAIEADLLRSKFIVTNEHEEEEEEDGDEHGSKRHHLDIHRALMRAEDDRQLDRVMAKFARDKTAMPVSSTLLHLGAKYKDSHHDHDDDDTDDHDGEQKKKLASRTDEALFRLIRDEQSDGDRFDYDDGDDDYDDNSDVAAEASYSDDDGLDPCLINEEEGEETEEAGDNDKLVESHLEDSLSALFTATTTVDKMGESAVKKPISVPPVGSLMDEARRARLLALDEPENSNNGTSAATSAVGPFKKKR